MREAFLVVEFRAAIAAGKPLELGLDLMPARLNPRGDSLARHAQPTSHLSERREVAMESPSGGSQLDWMHYSIVLISTDSLAGI